MSKGLEEVKLINKFLEIHEINSEEYTNYRLSGYLKSYNLRKFLLFNYDEKYEETFREAKRKMLNSVEKYSEEKINEEYFSFVYYYREESGDIISLTLAGYSRILKKSDSVAEYRMNLKEGPEEVKEKRKEWKRFITLFVVEELKEFCNKHILINTLRNINIKDVSLGYESSYAYEGEEKNFDQLDDMWQNRNYRGVIDWCDTIFGLFLKNFFEKQHLGEELVLEEGKKPDQMEEIFQELANKCKVPAIKENLNQIVQHFNFMRNRLKHKVPYKKDKINWEEFNKLPKNEKKLYTRIIIDLAKSLHNVLVILQKEE